MVKHPVLISLDEGTVGRFLKTEKVTEAEVDVLYYPVGMASIFSKGAKRIKRVPSSAVIGPLNPPGCPFSEGIYVLVCGSRGESWLADKIGLVGSRDIARLEREKAQIKLESEFKTSKITDMHKGFRTELRDVKESKDIFEKAKRSNVFDRRRVPPELDGGEY